VSEANSTTFRTPGGDGGRCSRRARFRFRSAEAQVELRDGHVGRAVLVADAFRRAVERPHVPAREARVAVAAGYEVRPDAGDSGYLGVGVVPLAAFEERAGPAATIKPGVL
jgi:hypothetical protein